MLASRDLMTTTTAQTVSITRKRATSPLRLPPCFSHLSHKSSLASALVVDLLQTLALGMTQFNQSELRSCVFVCVCV